MRHRNVFRALCASALVAGLACTSKDESPPPVCSFRYSSWSKCEPDGTQTRTITSSTPTGCTGTPVLTQPCTPGCTLTYSDWSECQPNGTQTRTITSSTPTGCTGTPVLTQACTPGCTLTYSDWGECQPGGTQTRTIVSSTPTGCTGTPVLTQACTPPDACRAIPALPPAYADWPQLEKAITSDAAIEAQVQDILSHMTLAQKVGQMIQGEIGQTKPEHVASHFLGSVLNGGGSWPGGERHAAAADWLALADQYWNASPAINGTKVPILWGIDAVHGNNNVHGATIFPHNIGLGAAHDACLVKDIGAATAAQVRATGQDWAFGPTLAVVRDDRWGRTFEGFSENPAIVRWYAQAGFKGFGDLDPDGKRLHGILATAKHYIGDGGTTNGKDQGLNEYPESDLINIFGQGYFGALGPGGGQTVMISFNSWNDRTGVRAPEGKLHGSKYLVNDVLKVKMGFDGLTVTDWDGIGQVTGCTTQDCPRAVNAGIDLFMFSDLKWMDFIANTMAETQLSPDNPKYIPIERINDAVTRILRVKARAGLLGPSAVKPSARAGAGAAGLLHRDLARKAVRESVVLLKNNGQVLPLALPGGRKVLVVGNSMDSFANQCGGWTLSWQGADVKNQDVPSGAGDTVLAGIKAAVGADKVDAYARSAEVPAGLDYTQYTAVIAVVGETPYAEGQGDIIASETLGRQSKYPEAEVQALLAKVRGHGVPVLTVLLSGRPLWVNKEINASDAFVAGFLPGTEGAGIADVLFRKADGSVNYEFTGKLPYSWPKSDCQTALNFGDASYDPLFPYAYGLTAASATQVPSLDETASAHGCGQASPISTTLPILTNTGLQDSPASGSPYVLYLGAENDWSHQVEVKGTALNGTQFTGNISVTGSSSLTVELQGDGREVVWDNSGKLAQIYAQAETASDLSAFLHHDGAMVFQGVLNEATTASLTAQVTCGYPCRGTVDITSLLGPVGQKTLFKIPLSCFKDAGDGLAFTKIDAPFQLNSQGPLDFTFAEVSWAQGVASDSDAAACPTLGVAQKK
jgi:beta-glucosidase